MPASTVASMVVKAYVVAGRNCTSTRNQTISSASAANPDTAITTSTVVAGTASDVTGSVTVTGVCVTGTETSARRLRAHAPAATSTFSVAAR